MPETTETATFDRSAEDLFAHLADFGRLAEWDPMFRSSQRLDQGDLGVGSRFHAVGEAVGQEFDLELEIVTYEAPTHVALRGTGDGLRTSESIRIEPAADGRNEVTYTSSFETDKPDLVDAMAKPAFTAVGKRAMSGMRDWLAG